MPELFLSIPLVILIILACHEAGRLLLRLIARENPFNNPLENALLKLAVGYIGVEFILTILGFARLFNSWIFWILFIILIASSLVFGRRSIAETIAGFKTFFRESFKLRLNSILAVVAILALLMDFILTCVPTTAWDALTYHYPLPAIWLREGFLAPRLDICYSELPMASEMLFAFAFGLGGLRPDNTGIGHLAANHLTWITGVFACLAMVALSRRLGENLKDTSSKNTIWDSWTPGLIAVIAFLSLPIIYVEEMEGGYIENFLVFLSLVMLIGLLHFKATKSTSILLIIGILAGGLLASKHTSLFLNALVLLILIAWVTASKKWKLIGSLGIAILITLIIPFPWYLKSYIHTGDPAWPFISQILRPHDALYPEIMYWSNPNVERSLWGFITYIYRLTWDESLTQFKFRLLSFYFLPLLPFVIWWSIRKGTARAIGFVTWILILLIYLLAPGEPRYLLVAWGLYAALGAWGLLVLLNKAPWITRMILPVLLIIPIGLSLIDRTGEVKHRIPTIIGTATVDEYFEKSLDIWPLINYINKETEPDAGIVIVEPRNFYIERPYVIWYPFPTPPTEHWYSTNDFTQLTHNKESGIRYVLVTYGPNYRALAIADFLTATQIRSEDARPLFNILPEWVSQRAEFAEPYFAYRRGGTPFYTKKTDPEFRAREFDVRSILQLKRLYASGWLEPVFIDERAGTVFKVISPEEVLE